MTDDQPDLDPERLARGLAALGNLLEQLRAATGERYEATDATASVRVALDADGLPESIEIEPQWRRTVGGEGLAGAVEEACRRAATARSEAGMAWVEQNGWLGTVSGLVDYVSGDEPPPELATRATATPPRSGTDTPIAVRSTQQIIDDIAALDEASGTFDPDALRASAPAYAGSAGLGRLSLSITSLGTVSCQADPDWVGRQETEDLSAAMASALATARAEIAAGRLPTAGAQTSATIAAQLWAAYEAGDER